ncbi:F-box/WD repeat-containing protein 7-like [Actinia tenebrosa]|uniref:F-box/WD repeat-containing protein 7-like n=1 Tax=Actinia tenebrosa TaxID=6105 RepID=A0A6P8HD91_ACTTE|nr:F-box/WD repeat-containing protein 7-like [Actinia tenebrosa]
MADAEVRSNVLNFDDVVNILSYLSPQDLVNASKVCRLWNEAANTASLWKRHCLQRWSFCNLNITPGEKTWNRYYVTRCKIDQGAATGRPGLDYVCKTLRGHKGIVNDAIFVTTNDIYDENIIDKQASPVVASCGRDKMVSLWNAHEGKSVWKNCDAHETSVSSLALIKPETSFASGDQQGVVNIWDVTTGQNIKLQETHSSEVTRLCCGPDVFGSSKEVTGQSLLYVASRSGSVKLWDIRDTTKAQHVIDTSIHNLTMMKLKGSYTLVLSGKGSLFQDMQAIKVYDIRNLATNSFRGPDIFSLDSPLDNITTMSWIPSHPNQLVAGYTSGSIRIWDITNGQTINTFKPHLGAVTALSAVGSKLISAGKECCLHLWHLEKNKSIDSFMDHNSEITDVYADAFKVMSCSRDFSIRVYSWVDKTDGEGKCVRSLDSRYTLLGGSLQRAGNGFEKIICDYTTCVGMANDVLKAYSFQV